MKSHHNLILLILITFGSLLTNTTLAEVQTTVQFQPPPESEQPKDTEGAASRQSSQCANPLPTSANKNSLNLMAVVPQRNHGLTTAQRPNLWIYLPETTAKQAILSIREEGNTPHWQQSVYLIGGAGVTGIKMSDDAPILEVGKNYQWAVILVCGDRPNPNDPVVTSWIERVAAETSQSSASPLEKASSYARQGIWYDALNVLMAEKSSLDNWHSLWNEYLKSAGLDTIAKQPVTNRLLLPE